MPSFLTTDNFYKMLCSFFLAIVAFVGAQLYFKIAEMQRDLLELKITLTKIQWEVLTKEDIKEICINEITKYHIKDKKWSS